MPLFNVGFVIFPKVTQLDFTGPLQVLAGGISNPRKSKGGGFPAWTEEDVQKYEARWPIGTRQRVWLDLLLYTGLRRGDAVQLGRQHVRDGIATLRAEKSQGAVTLTLPILPILQTTLDAGPCGDLAFICGSRGSLSSRKHSEKLSARPAVRRAY